MLQDRASMMEAGVSAAVCQSRLSETLWPCQTSALSRTDSSIALSTHPSLIMCYISPSHSLCRPPCLLFHNLVPLSSSCFLPLYSFLPQPITASSLTWHWQVPFWVVFTISTDPFLTISLSLPPNINKQHLVTLAGAQQSLAPPRQSRFDALADCIRT